VSRALLPCGTSAAWQRHWNAGEEPCQPCTDAKRAYQRTWHQRRRPQGARRYRRRNTAVQATVGRNIKAAREHAGLSVFTLARALGLSGVALNAWEAGRRDVGVPSLVRVAALLNVSPAALLPAAEPVTPGTRDRMLAATRWLVKAGDIPVGPGWHCALAGAAGVKTAAALALAELLAALSGEGGEET
jgi:DNA-binding transcriptional regulator YiaG